MPKDAARQASSQQLQPPVVHPIPIRQTSTYDSVVANLSALGPVATTSTRTVGSWGSSAARRFSTGFLSKNRSAPEPVSTAPDKNDTAPVTDYEAPVADSGNAFTNDSGKHPAIAEKISSQAAAFIDNILYSCWDRLPGSDKRVLLQVLYDGTVQIWDTSNLQEFALFFRAVVTCEEDGYPICASLFPQSKASSLETDTARSEPSLLILSDSGYLLQYSLKRHKIVKRIALSDSHQDRKLGKAVSVSVSARYIAVSHIAPAGISLFAAANLEQLSISPILDVATNPYTGHPVMTLSTAAGGRVLAYVSTGSMEDGETGIIATQGWKSGTSTSASGFAASSSAKSPSQGIAYADSARRVGESVVSGVGAFSRYGYSKYTEYRQQDAEKQKALLSKSAPAGRGYLLERARFEAEQSSQRPRSACSGQANVAGTVIVLDLAASERQIQSGAGLKAHRVVARFRPSESHATTLLSFSPSGSSILSASSEAHCFHVFELRCIGLLAGPSTRNGPSKVWHRYRLNRGYTPAQAVSASWSSDGRFVAVQTAKGTSHIYAINPQGGPASEFTHLTEAVNNESKLAPLSAVVEALARIRAPTESQSLQHAQRQSSTDKDNQDVHAAISSLSPPQAPEVIFLPHSDVPASFAYAAHSRSQASPGRSREVNLAYSYPHIGETVLATLILGGSSIITSAYSVAAPLASKATSTAMSGLSRLMRQQQQSAAPVALARDREQTMPSLTAIQEWRAYWPIGTAHRETTDQTEVKVAGAGHRSILPASANVSQAELLTFSTAAAVLPKSMYLSLLFDFHMYPPSVPDKAASHRGIRDAFAKGKFAIRNRRKLVVREEVSHQHPAGSADESAELHTAMHTILDEMDHQAQLARAGTAEDVGLAPAYPNGYGHHASKQTWSSFASNLPKSMPIPIKGMNQVARGALAGLRSPRLRALSHGSNAPAASTEAGTSVSFDEQEAVNASVPVDYPDPAKALAEEPIDLFSGHRKQSQPKSEHQLSTSLRSLHGHSFVPSPHTPSSLGVIPELSLDGGSSAEDTDRNNEEDLHARSSSAEEDQHAEAAAGADEWAGWKLDGIDDEPLEQLPEGKINVVVATAQPMVSSPLITTASMSRSPTVSDLPTTKKLLSAVSSAAPSPIHRDLLGSSPSSLSSNGGTSQSNTSKKKKQRGKR